MRELLTGPDYENTPRSTIEILEEVGLTPENIHDSKVIFFSNGVDTLEGVEEADINTFDIETFLHFDRIVPQDNTLDFVISVDNIYLRGDLDIPTRVDLLAASVRALNDHGEMRINQPEVDPEGMTETIEENFAWALYDRGIDITATYMSGNSKEESYLIIKRLTPNIN